VNEGLVVDLFAGAGGASIGVEAALGRPVSVALNHNETALAVHAANHKETVHLVMNVWKAKPLDVTKGRPVFALWASPDCTFHSRARGGKPRQQGIRALPYAVVRWIRETSPEQAYIENVPELEKWGPLLTSGPKKGHPDPKKRGKTFRHWVGELRRFGYDVEWRVLDAADYGAPTHRRRLFVIARRDGQRIVWPEPTHGKGRLPYKTAADCIDWSIPCHSIFLSEAEGKAVRAKRPLAEKTMWRIAQGLKRFVFDSAEPFIVKVNHGKMEPRHTSIHEPLSTVTASERGHAIVAPVLQQSGYGERKGQAARILNIREPLGTMVDGQKHALVMAWLVKHFGDPLRSDGGGGVVVGADLGRPLATVTARDHHSLAAVSLAPPGSSVGGRAKECAAFLSAYYGSDGTGGQQLSLPLRTITARDRLGLVMVEGTEYEVTDITFRMLQWQELLRAQFGRFAARYDLSFARSSKAKVKLIGNSVCPELAEALVRANQRDERAVAA
jgi:DNA (cytosine-5)-methyltransferase 1